MSVLTVSPALAEGPDSIDNVTIIGHQREVADVPGSAHVISEEELQLFLQSDVMRVLQTVPGVYVQEEEGFGLRPNIGIRGSGLDRSARIAVLEDGVLISRAPYSAPLPTISRPSAAFTRSKYSKVRRRLLSGRAPPAAPSTWFPHRFRKTPAATSIFASASTIRWMRC